jgi:hypothetical protein
MSDMNPQPRGGVTSSSSIYSRAVRDALNELSHEVSEQRQERVNRQSSDAFRNDGTIEHHIITRSEVLERRASAEADAKRTGQDWRRLDNVPDSVIRHIITLSKLTDSAEALEELEMLAAADPAYEPALAEFKRRHSGRLTCGTDSLSDEDLIRHHAKRLYDLVARVARENFSIRAGDQDTLDMMIARILHRMYGGTMPKNPHRARQSISRRLNAIARRQILGAERETDDSQD